MKDTKIEDGKIKRNGKQWSYTEVDLGVDGIKHKKPDIDHTKDLDAEEQAVVEFTLKGDGKRLVHTELKHKKNDYMNDYDRGSVEHTTKCRNYSWHKVYIPDGTVIREKNFSQRVPNTKAIFGKNLTFIECNLVNNELDPTWTLQSCNNAQIDLAAREAEEGAGN